MASSRWLKAVADNSNKEETPPKKEEPTPNVSMSDVRKRQQEKTENDWLTGQPVNQSLVNQLTSLDNQLTSVNNQLTTEIVSPPLVNQLTSQPINQPPERFYRSRTQRRLKGIRLPANNLERYERWCFDNKVDFQDAVDFALNWLTSQPVNQLTGQPVNQLTTLINNDINNELIINDEKANKVFNKYKELTGKPITTKDREAYREIAHLEYQVIERGLYTAIQRAVAAGSRVNSFKYALNCIHEAAKTSSQPQQASPSPQPAQLSSDELQSLVSKVVDMLKAGETIESISEQLGQGISPYQWSLVRSTALAQYSPSRLRSED